MSKIWVFVALCTFFLAACSAPQSEEAVFLAVTEAPEIVDLTPLPMPTESSKMDYGKYIIYYSEEGDDTIEVKPLLVEEWAVLIGVEGFLIPDQLVLGEGENCFVLVLVGPTNTYKLQLSSMGFLFDASWAGWNETMDDSIESGIASLVNVPEKCPGEIEVIQLP